MRLEFITLIWIKRVHHMAEKIRYMRFLPFLGGSIALIVSFIASIPLGTSFSLNFRIIYTGSVDLYIWGMVEGGVIWSEFHQFTLDNLIPLTFWIFTLFAGIIGIISVSYKSNPKTIKKLLLLSGFVFFLEFAYFTAIYFIQYGNYSLGLGYPILGVEMILYFLTAGLVTEYRKK